MDIEMKTTFDHTLQNEYEEVLTHIARAVNIHCEHDVQMDVILEAYLEMKDSPCTALKDDPRVQKFFGQKSFQKLACLVETVADIPQLQQNVLKELSSKEIAIFDQKVIVFLLSGLHKEPLKEIIARLAQEDMVLIERLRVAYGRIIIPLFERALGAKLAASSIET